MDAFAADLPVMPMVDIRDGGPLRHAVEGRGRALALRDDCLAWFPAVIRPLLPLLDSATRRWLVRTSSPYVAEIDAIAVSLGFAGIWFLNGSYQWCCTTLARDEAGHPWLLRTLDWPFPGLGRHAEVARMAGPAGEFWSVTWPGYAGVLTAMAPGRFGAAMNQAPLCRRMQHPWLRPVDLGLNLIATWRHVRHLPPDQLLRDVFETCHSFADAKARLESTPVARPVIYTLIGCAPGERCVIERTEEAYTSRHEDTAAANDWIVPRPNWEARIAGRLALLGGDAAVANSRARRIALAGWNGAAATESFGWITPPVLNPFTRMAVEMCPAIGTLRAVGYELAPGREHPEPATLPCEVVATLAA